MAETLEKLTNRTTSINFLRDALYRLNEYDFNNSLPKSDYKEMFDSIISASKTIAEAELKQTVLATEKESTKQAIETTKQLLQNSEAKHASAIFNTFPIYFQICREEDRKAAKEMVIYLNRIGFVAVGSEKLSYNLDENEVRYFNDSDQLLAESVVKNLNDSFKSYSFIAKKVKLNNVVPLGRVEVWLK